MTKPTHKKSKNRKPQPSKTHFAGKNSYHKRKANKQPDALVSAKQNPESANDAISKPDPIKDARIAETMFSERSPRCGKKSFFFGGGEFALPTQVKTDKMKLEDIVAACCKMAVQCNVSETYWWPVHKYTDRNNGSAFYSINTQPRGHGKSVNAGVIIIKKSDTDNISEKQVKQMIDEELQHYSDWLNAPMFLRA